MSSAGTRLASCRVERSKRDSAQLIRSQYKLYTAMQITVTLDADNIMCHMCCSRVCEAIQTACLELVMSCHIVELTLLSAVVVV
jgi:hypothetical protein